MQREVHRLDAARREDFHAVHAGAPWCACAAWWVPTWDGWGERTASENRAVRDALFDAGEHDGYLLYVDGAPAGWCQAVPRDRLVKLARQFSRAPDPAVWAISCFFITAAKRGQGLATFLLGEVLRDLRTRGATRVEAFPKRGEGLDVEDLWNGPEAMFRAAGFTVERDDPKRPVLALALV